MELGERLRQARINAGLSQRQLCGDEITRNMLSQIEHGTCNPSVSTLCYLAKRLELPVSFFLEEGTAVSSNGNLMDAAWKAFEGGNASAALAAMEGYRGPDTVYDREHALLKALVLLQLASDSLEEGRQVYADRLLDQIMELERALPWLPELTQRRLVLQGKLQELTTEAPLRCLDEELMLHASAALGENRPKRAAALLDACENQECARWNLLRGRAYFAMEEYAAAAKFLLLAEKEEPTALPLLEKCFSSLGDFQLAYHYACKQRG